MVTIRPFMKSPTPATEWVESLPKDTEYLMVLRSGEVLTIFEKIEINGETTYVERKPYPDVVFGVLRSLVRTSESFPER